MGVVLARSQVTVAQGSTTHSAPCGKHCFTPAETSRQAKPFGQRRPPEVAVSQFWPQTLAPPSAIRHLSPGAPHSLSVVQVSHRRLVARHRPLFGSQVRPCGQTAPGTAQLSVQRPAEGMHCLMLPWVGAQVKFAGQSVELVQVFPQKVLPPSARHLLPVPRHSGSAVQAPQRSTPAALMQKLVLVSQLKPCGQVLLVQRVRALHWPASQVYEAGQTRVVEQATQVDAVVSHRRPLGRQAASLVQVSVVASQLPLRQAKPFGQRRAAAVVEQSSQRFAVVLQTLPLWQVPPSPQAGSELSARHTPSRQMRPLSAPQSAVLAHSTGPQRLLARQVEDPGQSRRVAHGTLWQLPPLPQTCPDSQTESSTQARPPLPPELGQATTNNATQANNPTTNARRVAEPHRAKTAQARANTFIPHPFPGQYLNL